jgi:hypothetical protein
MATRAMACADTQAQVPSTPGLVGGEQTSSGGRPPGLGRVSDNTGPTERQTGEPWELIFRIGIA